MGVRRKLVDTVAESARWLVRHMGQEGDIRVEVDYGAEAIFANDDMAILQDGDGAWVICDRSDYEEMPAGGDDIEKYDILLTVEAAATEIVVRAIQEILFSALLNYRYPLPPATDEIHVFVDDKE
jgi:hypothetical protein